MLRIALFFLISFNLQAAFLPTDIELNHEDQDIFQLQVNKKMVKKTIKKFKKTFFKDASGRFGKISINDVWWSKTFNAYAMKYGPVWRITVHGGLLKHKSLTSELLSLVLCHELGHFLGGAPKFSVIGKKWSSYEGQADFWTGSRCLKKLFQSDDNISIVQSMNIPTIAVNNCNTIYKNERDRALCYRIATTGLQMGHLISEITGKDEPALDTPDSKIVEQTYKDHPNFQCRVDTYFQAALCNSKDQINDENPSKGSCEEETFGPRPRCWYKHL